MRVSLNNRLPEAHVIQTRLPHVHGALANHFAAEPMSEHDFGVALTLMERGVYLADLPVDVWKSLRQISPGALAASVAGG
jgi:hypothetical protein